ncbi:PLP-dependent transferase [Xylariaceae sp. FL1019]|nr:PLP-dependent transferase [Xylariaceae sp. FL1019]
MAAASATSYEGSGRQKPINLLRGWPATTLLPADALRTASQIALSEPKIWNPGLEYGPDSGYQPLREELAGWLDRFYNAPHQNLEEGSGTAKAGAENFSITGGASQSVACLLQSFTDPGETLAVWMVAPCYFLACQIFADAGFAGRLKAVGEDEEGVDLVALERSILDLEAKTQKERSQAGEQRYKKAGPHRKIYKHIIYCVPSFSNPSGRTMSLGRRKGLVDLARKYDALVICDDVYDMLQWHTNPSAASLDSALLPRLADMDLALGPSPHDPEGKHFGHAVSNGSFSKLVGPGVRTGWTYSTPDFAFGVSQTGSTKSGGAPSQLTATIVCELLKDSQGGLDAHIRQTLRPTYARRHGLLMKTVLKELVPLGIQVIEHSLQEQKDFFGGYFVWMNLPTTTDGKSWPTAKEIAERCRATEDLMIGNGELFAVHGDEAAAPFNHAIRLCFAWEDEEDLVNGVERLGRVIRQMLNEEPGSWDESRRAERNVDEDK